MAAVWKTQCETSTQKLVLLALADNANDDGICWPSLATIAEKCDLDRRTVITIIARLEDMGALSVDRKTTHVNRYRLPVPKVDALKLNTSDPRSLPGAPRSPALVISDHLTSDPRSPDPSYNHHLEPSGGRNGSPPSHLSATERISLEREREEKRAKLKSLKGGDYISEKEKKQMAVLKDRINKIDRALHIEL